MNKEVKYYSQDKLYHIKKKEDNNIFNIILLSISILLIVSGIFSVINSTQIFGSESLVNYTETGKTDYVVYLKDNNFYRSKYLNSGMRYVASLINTVNPKFKYEIHADENMDLEYSYKIIGTLNISDSKDTSGTPMYTNDYVLLSEVKDEITSNNLVINEEAIIDYTSYNEIVNSYKSNLSLSVEAELIVKMVIMVKGVSELSEQILMKSNELSVTIPLSEQTINISINNDNINNNGMLLANIDFRINSLFGLILGTVIIVIGLTVIIIAIKKIKEYKKKNIYLITLNKTLRDYDSLIVSGKANINENNYTNIIIANNFQEMVDASINLKSPIIYYEVIPGEKSIFVIINGDTLYKFRLSKAYLQREQENNKN